MLLSCTTQILVFPILSQTYIELAEKLLNEFVVLCSCLYGDHLVSYNVHSLVHLTMCVEIHGPLDQFSCFKYENFLQKIKNLLKRGKYLFQELSNRLLEIQKSYLSTSIILPNLYH